MYAATLAFHSALSKEANLFYADSYTKDTVSFSKQTNLFYTDGSFTLLSALVKGDLLYKHALVTLQFQSTRLSPFSP